jgi:hypothetical protein
MLEFNKMPRPTRGNKPKVPDFYHYRNGPVSTKGLSGQRLRCISIKNQFDRQLHALTRSVAFDISTRSFDPPEQKDNNIWNFLTGNKGFNKRFVNLVSLLRDLFITGDRNNECFIDIFQEYYINWSVPAYRNFMSLRGDDLEGDCAGIIKGIVLRLIKDKAYGVNT